MAYAVHTPRLNNNDDEVRLTDILVRVGERVAVGQPLAQVETDKAVVAVESDQCGYVLRVMAEVDTIVTVGSVLFWLGDVPDEVVSGEEGPTASLATRTSSAEPTAKARFLIAQRGLNVSEIPARGDRLTVEDVEAYLISRREEPADQTPAAVSRPLAAGSTLPLSMEERGMLRSVLWHRDEAVPAYLEIDFDQTRWEKYAKAYAAERRMLGDPLLPLIAHRLVTIARDHPKLNSTIVDSGRYAYKHVNLGFTIQVQQSLYLVVVQQAEAQGPQAFIEALNKLHRKAIARRLLPEDLQGPTVAFSSMARWHVSRHTPILPPHVSMIVAHTVSKDNRAVLGATYDHRILSGGDTVAILERLSQSPEGDNHRV
jgi:pyruvate/2-oxoglutarate dehydrogenase complex dihydrolipoamide acyltransferase (E2) component